MLHSMKVTFIRPNLYDDRSSDAMEPLCFAILKSLTPDDIETAFYDERLEPIPVDEDTDLVAMTVETYTARRAYQIAAAYRRRGIPVVMGGYHPTFLPEEALEHADAVVKGDAEGIWQHVLADAQNGGLKPLYESAAFPDLAGVMPDRSIFNGKKYTPAAPMPGLKDAPGVTDQKLADVATFVRHAWNNRKGAVKPDVISDVRKSLADRATTFSPEELQKTFK